MGWHIGSKRSNRLGRHRNDMALPRTPETETLDVIVIGAGQAGLASSYHLSQRGIDHMVIERGSVANSWAKERWDSLTLLSPNWHSRLPGYRYEGPDPGGFRTRSETVSFLQDYARKHRLPVRESTEVTSLSKTGNGRFLAKTTAGTFIAKAVVIATGACNRPNIPPKAAKLPDSITSIATFDYRNPGALPRGAVLVVGASASGVQIARELQGSGRQVWLCVGTHARAPRRYGSRDIIDWLVDIGVFDQALTDMPDPQAAPTGPSIQLHGSPVPQTLDLNALQALGVRLLGRFEAVDGPRIALGGNLAQSCAAADEAMWRMLGRIEEYADRHHAHATEEFVRPEPTSVPGCPPTLDLDAEGISTVVWATGYLPNYDYLRLPIVGPDGRLIQTGGVTPVDGVYAVGLPFMRKRKSAFIDGVGEDAAVIVSHIEAYLVD